MDMPPVRTAAPIRCSMEVPGINVQARRNSAMSTTTDIPTMEKLAGWPVGEPSQVEEILPIFSKASVSTSSDKTTAKRILSTAVFYQMTSAPENPTSTATA